MRVQPRFAQLAAGAAFAVVVATAALWLDPPSQAGAQGRPTQYLARFEGSTLDGKRAGSDLFQKRRGVIFLWADKDPDRDRAAKLLTGLTRDAERANVGVLGVSRDPDPALAQHYARLRGFEFPILVDGDGAIARKLDAPPGTSMLVLVDAEGKIVAQLAGLASQPTEIDAGLVAQMRQLMQLPPDDAAATPIFGVLPAAPPFSVTSTDGAHTAQLSDYSGKVLVFLFFLPTCPHCHAMLKYLNGLAAQLGAQDLAIVPVSVSDKKYVVEEMVSDLKLGFPAYLDPDRKAQNAYGSLGEVPEVFVIDRAGKVVQRTAGDSPRIEALVTLSIRHELGGPPQILLDKAGYSGDEFCAVCHRDQHATWLLTGHANAWDTLVEHGADRDPQCLRCHTVGFGKPGGFDPEQRPDHL